VPPSNSKLGGFFRYGDVWLVVGLLGTVLLLILPVPSFLLDTLLATNAKRMPLGVKPSSRIGKEMTAAAQMLDAYNNGLLTPACDPVAPTLALTEVEAEIAFLTDRTLAASLAAANLVLAKQMNLDMVVNCAACYNRLASA
jgi:hypothetical protein